MTTQSQPGPGVPNAASTLALSGLVTAIVLMLLSMTPELIRDKFFERGTVPYVVTWLTAWSSTLLFFKLRQLRAWQGALELDLLPVSLGERITPENAPLFVEHLDGLPVSRDNPLTSRIRRALHHFEARGDTREVADQLATRAQADADAVDSSYSIVRVFIWAVPVLGFIGTVIGISEAVAGFSTSVGGAADLDVMKESIGTVTSGLGVAFDTTLVALVMSIFIMFPSSSLQKAEEDFLADIDDLCDARLIRRLVGDAGAPRGDARVIEEAIAREMAAHHAELRGWLDRLGQVGESLTGSVVSGWTKIDEQIRIRQEQQLEQLGRWAGVRQRELSEELSETQRELIRDFRTSLEGMSAESRRVQEEGAHRLDEQLVGIERLHRRLQDEQQSASSTQREQSQTLASATEQLSRTLARVRSDASEARDEGVRQLGAFSEGLQAMAHSAQEFQHQVAGMEETQARALRESSERLAQTLERLDERLQATSAVHEVQRAESRDASAAMEQLRSDAARRDSEVRDAQVEALATTSAAIEQTLESLRNEAHAVRGQLGSIGEELGPQLAREMESISSELATPWRRQLAHIERLHARLEVLTRDAERKRSGIRRFLGKD